MREPCPDCRCLTSSAPDPCPECAAERRRSADLETVQAMLERKPPARREP